MTPTPQCHRSFYNTLLAPICLPKRLSPEKIRIRPWSCTSESCMSHSFSWSPQYSALGIPPSTVSSFSTDSRAESDVGKVRYGRASECSVCVTHWFSLSISLTISSMDNVNQHFHRYCEASMSLSPHENLGQEAYARARTETCRQLIQCAVFVKNIVYCLATAEFNLTRLIQYAHLHTLISIM